ncbi:hypothetical protein D3C77_674840 [compost metagenome]
MYIWFIAFTAGSPSRRPYPANFLTTEPFFCSIQSPIVFPVWTGTCQRDTSGRTVFKQGFVDKFGSIINIKAEKWEWQTFLNLINGPDDQLSVTRR